MVILLLQVGCSYLNVKNQRTQLSILQGLTTATSAQFSIVSPYGKDDLRITVEGEGPGVSVVNISEMYREENSMGVGQWMAQGLQLGIEYTLLIKDSKNRILDRRIFSALDTSNPRPKLAIASCMDDAYTDIQKDIWNGLIQKRPDMLLMIGDNVYTDSKLGYNSPASPSEIWIRYLEARNTLEIFKSRRLIPTLAIWDDHDYGRNNGDKSYKHKDDSKKIFEAFYAQKPQNDFSDFKLGPGVASIFRAFNMQLIFLDNRSFRDKVGQGSHWGIKQEKWLMRHLNSKKRFSGNVIINGDQFFGGYHRFESFEGHRKKHFLKIMKQIFNTKFPSLFVSGDRHLFELMEIPQREFGYKTYEVTSSGIHAKLYPDNWKEFPNPRQIKGVEMINSYALLLFDTTEGLTFRVQNFDRDSNLLFEKRLKISR